jgi:small subunit ribosomal protein S9
MADATAPATPAAPAAPAAPVAVRAGRKVTVGGKTYYWGTGRRKSSVARVRVVLGTGKFTVNGRQVDEFFKETKDRHYVRGPLVAANLAANSLDVIATAHGGGYTGQAGALVQGLGRALVLFDGGLHKQVQEGGFLTRDSRMKERKKYGRRGARRSFQFSKR